jgi:farnesyl-diphosphate farnesyltransferase
MKHNAKVNERKIADELLRSTARSFYLTLHALPSSIRWPMSLGYLLARTTDTVADVVDLPASVRLSALALMLEVINSGSDSEKISQLEKTFFPLKLNSPEYMLLTHFNQFIKWLYELDETVRKEVIWVLNEIVKGQQFDVEKFGRDQKEITCVTTIKELDNYIYSVAGSVGEFWTKLCLQNIANYSNKTPKELYPLAISFGKGLQLVNILRDIPQDLTNRRCYLPQEQLQQSGLDPHDLTGEIHRFDPIVNYWWEKALGYLQEGWEYMLSLNHRRIRGALALPLLLGFATLRLLQDKTYLSNPQPVKVSHRQVKRLMLIAALGMFSKKALKTDYTKINIANTKGVI